MNPTGARQRPVLLVVDDDPAALRAMCRELDVRYGRDYHVVCEDSVAGAERALRTLRETGEAVALVLADHRLAETSGAELLALTRQLHPLAKRALLVPWGAWRDRATAAAILRAVAAGGAELVLGAEPDLFLDGRCCCDQSAAHRLVRSGLIAAATLGLVGQRVAAALTPAGTQVLAVATLAS